MRLPKSSPLAKINALVTCPAFVANVVGFATPYWLYKSFLFPLNRGGIAFLPVDARLGLFSACKTEHYLNGNSYTDCSSEGAADWQIISAVLAIVGLVFSLLGALLSVLGVALRRLADKFGLKIAIGMCHFLTCSLFVGPLLMFPINSRIQVQPELSPFQVDFELGYSYIIVAACTGVSALLVLLNTIDAIWSRLLEEKEDDQVALSKH